MKKIFTILLLACLGLNITGYHIIFKFRQATLKTAMKTMLRRQANSQDEVVFSFAINAPQNEESPEWEEEHEFRYKGKMYDVIDQRIEDGQLIVRCISDEKETELIKKYEEILEKQFGGRAKKRSVSLLKLICTPFTIPSAFMTSAIVRLLHNQYSIYRCNIPFVCRDVITPPPRFL